MRKCVFFDRDGIVNQSPGPGYVERWEDFVLLPEFVDVLRAVTDMGFDAVIVSNQRGIARGILDRGEVERIHENLQRVLNNEYDLALLDVIYCPHDEGQCTCRKPQPGMLLEAARRHNIDMDESWMIGDQERDIEAGKSAGCRTVLVSEGDARSQADFKVGSMAELSGVVRRLLGC
ncbi:MAG: HAD family hydrolase [Kiritimatiellia bacterium]|jgi:histidinol-phosphate phosphatase family protein|nr:HAD family hydrolase [Kiritimatiellia bacterium]MDP6847963.1 HAD family hydrolase [Kiritimatiellia bacterium]